VTIVLGGEPTLQIDVALGRVGMSTQVVSKRDVNALLL
jgi:hypothetical protein